MDIYTDTLLDDTPIELLPVYSESNFEGSVNLVKNTGRVRSASLNQITEYFRKRFAQFVN